MSPEQVRAQDIDARTDLFSLGIVLYEMATGAPPFRGDSAGLILDGILNRAPAPVGRLNPGLPQELARIIGRCLEKDRELRYQHASEIRADLQRLQRDRQSTHVERNATPVRQSLLAQPRIRWLSIGAAILVAAAVAGAIYDRRPATLTDKDTIVLAEFTNTTGDPVFDETLRQGLMVQLQQSPFLSLVSDQRIRQTLPLMSQPRGCATDSGNRSGRVRTRPAAPPSWKDRSPRSVVNTCWACARRTARPVTSLPTSRPRRHGKKMFWACSVGWRPVSERALENRSPPSETLDAARGSDDAVA